MHGLQAEYSDRIQFTYLDIDDPNTAALKAQLGYRVQPHLFLLNANGEVVQQWLGYVTREEFIAAFKAVLQ